MKPLFHVSDLKRFFLIMLIVSATLSREYDEDFILDICKSLKLSSVTLVHFTEQKSLVQLNNIFNLQEFLSKEKIMSLAVSAEKVISSNLGNSTDLKSLRRISNAMNIFFIMSEGDLKKMTNLSKILFPSGQTNLIMFMKTDENPLLEICENPVDNPFHLNDGISLIVKCYEDATIREWYSLNNGEMRIYERATWEPKAQFVLKLKSVVQREKDVLNGKVLRIGKVAKTEEFAYNIYNVFRTLEQAANFTTKTVKIANEFGTWNKSTKSWSGAIGLIVNNEVDLVVSWYEMTPERFVSVDFTVILTTTQLCLYLRRPTSRSVGFLSRYWQHFNSKSWTALVWSYIIAMGLITMMRTKVENTDQFGLLILDNVLNIWGIYCQQGLAEFPKQTSLRLFYCVMFTFSFTILAVYSGGFVSYLTISDPSLPFNSLEEFGQVGTHKLALFDLFGTYDYINNTMTSPWKEAKQYLMNKKELPHSVEDALNMICKDDVVILDNDLFSQIIPVGKKVPCSLVKIPTGTYERYAMILRKKSPYTKAMNYYINKMKEVGPYHHFGLTQTRIIESVYFGKEANKVYYRTTFLDIVPLLLILLGGAILSIISIVLENLYFWTFNSTNFFNRTLYRLTHSKH